MDKFNERHTAFAIILFFSITMFFQLGSMEIQPWDEGLYAYRAKAIHEKGVWWDQTEYSIGGLYSSSYPPLTVWSMALGMKFIEPHHAVRLLSAFCGSLSLLMVYLIGRRLLNAEMSILAIIGLAVTLFWSKYSRQGMTDIPVVAFSLLALWAIVKLKETENMLRILPYLLVFLIAFAAALMSKVLVSLLPLLFVAILVFEKVSIGKKTAVIITSFAAIAIALPWHIHMFNQYGYEFYRIFFASHVYTAVESNTANIGSLYYVNQLIISNSFFILAIFLIIFAMIKRKTIAALMGDRDSYLLKTMFIWFGSLLILFSLSITKLPHYVVYMIIPALILSAVVFQDYARIIRTGRLRWLILSLILAAFLWGFSYDLRQEIKLLLTLKAFTLSAVLYLSGILLMTFLSLKLSDKELKHFSKYLIPKFSYAILIVMVIRIIVMTFMFNNNVVSGGLGAAEVLQRLNKSSYIYLFHKHNQSDIYNPQIAWYTNGWNIGGLKGKTVINTALPETGINFRMITDTDTLPNLNIVYYVSEFLPLAQTVVRELIETRPIIYTSKNYIIFGVRHFARKEGKKV